jgi:aspartate-semialdehyde dehydrogenase
MSSGEALKPMKVVQVCADAPGADTLRSLIARPDIPYELEAVASLNPDLRKKKLGNTHLKGPAELNDVPIIGMMDAIENTDAPVVFSNLPPRLVDRYETRLAAGRLVITNASTGRGKPEVAVAGAFVNPGHIDELYSRKDLEGRTIDTGGSLAALISVPLAPLHRNLGISSMAVSSLQGWSDARMARVPELVADSRDDTHAIEGEDRKDALRSDLGRLLGASMEQPADMDIDSVELRHGHWVRGHYARLDLRLERGTSRKEIEELWRDSKVPGPLDGARPQLRSITKAFRGKRWPGRHHSSPVKLEQGSLLRTDTDPPVLHTVQPMRVQARVLGFDANDPARLVIETAGDNIVQGIAGGALLNAIYARARGYLG